MTNNDVNDALSQIKKWAEEANASHVKIMKDTQFVAHQSVLDSCAANMCGKYGKCWTCPPNNGTFDEISTTLSGFANAVLIQNISKLEDSYDIEGMDSAMKEHNDMIRNLGRIARESYPNLKILALGCGGCGYCEVCSCPDVPCVSPDNSISSVEGYGMDVRTMVHEQGLQYINGVNTVSYVGLILVA